MKPQTVYRQRRKAGLAWLNRFRRLTIRHETRADIQEAFVILGCTLICLN